MLMFIPKELSVVDEIIDISQISDLLAFLSEIQLKIPGKYSTHEQFDRKYSRYRIINKFEKYTCRIRSTPLKS